MNAGTLMKTFLTAVLACAICSTAALAGQPPSTAGTKPPGQNLTLTPQAPGAVGIPGLDIKKKGIASVGTSGSVYRSAADSIPPLVIQFSSTNQNVIQEWEEDLTVMTRLIEEALQRTADEDLTDVPFILGFPITLLGSPNSGAKAVKPSRRKKSEPSDMSKELDRTIQELVRNRPPRAGTVLTMRVRKGDVDAFSKGTINYDAFAKKVATNTYL